MNAEYELKMEKSYSIYIEICMIILVKLNSIQKIINFHSKKKEAYGKQEQKYIVAK